MNVVSAVANIVKERDYYIECYKDHQAIVKQLTEGPGEIEYIHPLDLAELLNDLTKEEATVDVYKWTDVKDTETIYCPKTQKKYKQSVLIPAKTKNIG